eukprot:6354025-Prymnesium_polylepis.1
MLRRHKLESNAKPRLSSQMKASERYGTDTFELKEEDVRIIFALMAQSGISDFKVETILSHHTATVRGEQAAKPSDSEQSGTKLSKKAVASADLEEIKAIKAAQRAAHKQKPATATADATADTTADATADATAGASTGAYVAGAT